MIVAVAGPERERTSVGGSIPGPKHRTHESRGVHGPPLPAPPDGTPPCSKTPGNPSGIGNLSAFNDGQSPARAPGYRATQIPKFLGHPVSENLATRVSG